ncbi:MAG: hypothetical protein JO249_24330 [Acidobacteria bacterium]|nr:hypothetical protein [Acidobacteriota bacterium]
MWKNKDAATAEAMEGNSEVQEILDTTNETVRRMTEPFRGNISTYREAVEQFTTNALEFLKCIPTLNRTRDSYQRAMSISSEVRQILDTGDETLRKMMSQIEEAVNVQLANRPEKKRPEVVKVEPLRSAEDTNGARILP